MSRQTLMVSGILLVFLTEVVLSSILVNLNMQREGAGPNLNRELLLPWSQDSNGERWDKRSPTPTGHRCTVWTRAMRWRSRSHTSGRLLFATDDSQASHDWQAVGYRPVPSSHSMSVVRTEDWPGDAISCVPKPRATDVEDVAAEVLRHKKEGTAQQWPADLVA